MTAMTTVNENSNLVEVNSAQIIQAQESAVLDTQVSTAKAYPRHLPTVLNQIRSYAMLDSETAEECFYVLRRSGQGGTTTIEGISVRFAEILASTWGNLRVEAHVVANDGKTITARGTAWDLESNVAMSAEVKRRITDKWGRTYNEDMQVVTGNAAQAIAFRNAVMKVVPKAILRKILQETKQVAMGQALDLETSRQRMIDYFAKLGVDERQLLDYLSIDRREEIDKEMVYELRGLANAIKEGTTTVADTFTKPMGQAREAQEARQKAQEARSRAAQAMSRQRKTVQVGTEAQAEPGAEAPREKNNDQQQSK